MAEASLIGSLTAPPSARGLELINLPRTVKWLEVRADLLGDLDPEWLRGHFDGQLLYVLRSKAEGGEYEDSLAQRHQRLAAAARHYDLIEIEGSTDLSESLLAQIPAQKRLVAWHGAASDAACLESIFARLSSVAGRFYKLVIKANRMSDELNALSLLKSLGRSDTIAYANGPLGFWSRLAALQLGAPAIFAMANGLTIPAEPSLTQLIQDYGLPEVTPIKELFAIIGSPVFHSLSPRLHNAAYRALGHKALFVPLQVDSFNEFWQEVVQSKVLDFLGFPLKGMTVASPHKESALLTARRVSPMAHQGESANVIVRNNGHWEADTTDPEVIYMATRERSIQLVQRRAAVIGCGGAGRAIAATLAKSGARVTLVNRGVERGRHAAHLLGLPYIALSDFDAEGYDLVVNATPVGRDSLEAPCELEQLSTETVVIDLVYGSRPTPLVSNSRTRGRTVIDGRDVLLAQVLRQFRLMTGQEMPESIASETLGWRPPAATAVGSVAGLIQQSAPVLGTDAN